MRPLNDAIARFFGLEAVSEELIAACIHRIRTRCSQVDLSIYRRKPAERRLQTEACEAICGVFRDYFPDRADKFQISGRWPGARVMIKGSRTGYTAWIEPWIGLDYHDPEDGMELIEIDIDLRADRRTITERVNDVLFHREPRPTKKAERPELELTRKAPPAKEFAPIGKPEEPKRATAQKPIQKQRPEPPKPGKPRPR